MDIWHEEKDDAILGPLSERMGVRERGRGPLLVSDEELEACSEFCCFSSSPPVVIGLTKSLDRLLLCLLLLQGLARCPKPEPVPQFTFPL